MDGTTARTALAPAWRHLPWDSDFFGTPIGRIDLRTASPAAITAAESAAIDAGLLCLYAELDAADVAGLARAQRSGYRVVDMVLDLTHPTTERPGSSSAAVTTRVATTADLDALDEQIEAVAPWSRFAADPRFGPGAAAALHRAWVERAVTDERRELIVAEDASGIVGISTLRNDPAADHPVPPPGSNRRIDLIATTRPGTGAAEALVRAAFELLGPGPSVGGPIAARNVASLRFSEQIGYRVHRATCHLHRWLDEPPAAAAGGPEGTRP